MSNEDDVEEDADFESGSAPTEVEHIKLSLRTKFYPWHKPRKQWLRTQQWAQSISGLVDTLNLKLNNKALSYLSLPGPDLLDVRIIQPVCEMKEISLFFLGINNGEDDGDESAKYLNATLLNQVRSMKNIDQASDVVLDKFEHLAKLKSIAYERVINSKQSFDVINLDLCRSLAEGESGIAGPNNFSALKHLLVHQSAKREDDWLLFITTRTNTDMVNKNTMVILVNYLNTIVDEEESFIPKIVSSKLISEAHLTDGIIDVTKLDANSFTNVFSLAVSHWILQNLLDNDPAWRVDMLPQYGYHVQMGDSSCDMLSLGYYCKKISKAYAPDPFGIALMNEGPQPEEKTITHKKLSRKVRRRVASHEDIDLKLFNADEIYQECLEGSAQLLKSARYDEEEYRVWAAEQKEIMNTFIQSIVIPTLANQSVPTAEELTE